MILCKLHIFCEILLFSKYIWYRWFRRLLYVYISRYIHLIWILKLLIRPMKTLLLCWPWLPGGNIWVVPSQLVYRWCDLNKALFQKLWFSVCDVTVWKHLVTLSVWVLERTWPLKLNNWHMLNYFICSVLNCLFWIYILPFTLYILLENPISMYIPSVLIG